MYLSREGSRSPGSPDPSNAADAAYAAEIKKACKLCATNTPKMIETQPRVFYIDGSSYTVLFSKSLSVVQETASPAISEEPKRPLDNVQAIVESTISTTIQVVVTKWNLVWLSGLYQYSVSRVQMEKEVSQYDILDSYLLRGLGHVT